MFIYIIIIIISQSVGHLPPDAPVHHWCTWYVEDACTDAYKQTKNVMNELDRKVYSGSRWRFHRTKK
jgi:hypothetical protein